MAGPTDRRTDRRPRSRSRSHSRSRSRSPRRRSRSRSRSPPLRRATSGTHAADRRDEERGRLGRRASPPRASGGRVGSKEPGIARRHSQPDRRSDQRRSSKSPPPEKQPALARTASSSVLDELKEAGGLKESGGKEPTTLARTNSVLDELKSAGGLGGKASPSPSPPHCGGKQQWQAIERRPSLGNSRGSSAAAKSSRCLHEERWCLSRRGG